MTHTPCPVYIQNDELYKSSKSVELFPSPCESLCLSFGTNAGATQDWFSRSRNDASNLLLMWSVWLSSCLFVSDMFKLLTALSECSVLLSGVFKLFCKETPVNSVFWLSSAMFIWKKLYLLHFRKGQFELWPRPKRKNVVYGLSCLF